MTDHQVKIDIIGGYLGAGKTTFLNKLLRDGLKSERVVIIENEFGDEPVDDAILEDAGLEMRTLPSGCICCTLKADFITSIEDIVAKCDPDRILIEPTGLASPIELQNTCELAARFIKLPVDVRLNSITAIVDAIDAVEMIEYEIPVYLRQIDQANVIVLSHTQELDASVLAEAITAIREIAPAHAIVVDTPWENLDALEILTLSEQAYAEHMRADDKSNHGGDGGDGHNHGHDHEDEKGHHTDGAHGHGCNHEHGHHHSYEGFSSQVIFLTKPFDTPAVDQLTVQLKSKGVARAKGFLPAFEGGLFHYEYVNGRATATTTTYDGPAKLVVIGRNLPAIDLE